MNVTAGYWRKNNLSDIIEPCFNLPAACLGGEGNSSIEFCYEGHIGALCEECDLGAD